MRWRLGLANTAFSFCLATVTFASLASATPPAASPIRPAAHADGHGPVVTRPAPRPSSTVKAAPSVAVPAPIVRDWVKAPAIVEHVAPGEIRAVSDLHGHFEQAFKLFEGNGLIRGKPSAPGQVEWTGGNTTLVVVGDSINKGPGSVPIVDMLRQLQKEAPKVGGKVIVTLGNHEAAFLQDPLSERSLRDGTHDARTGFGHEIIVHGEAPQAVAAGTDAAGRGQWIRSLPFAAKVNDYFFVHSGNTDGMTTESLTATIQNAMKKGGFGHEDILGWKRNSVLGADDWKATAAAAPKNAEKLGVKHIVMGHIPDALDARGEIARTKDGALIKIDTGLGNDAGEPRMLRIGPRGGVKQLDVAGERSKVKKHDSD